VLLPDGRVFCVPSYSTTARIYDPITDTLITPSGSYPGGSAFSGGVLLPDGRVFCVPSNSTTARIYNPSTDTLITPSGSYPGTVFSGSSFGSAFNGGVLLPDGRVFCVPSYSTTARIYNPSTNTLITPSGSYPGSNAFNGGVLLPDGRVFCVPSNSQTARIYGSPLGINLPMERTHNAFDNGR
jgi:WD40 repeat protein